MYTLVPLSSKIEADTPNSQLHVQCMHHHLGPSLLIRCLCVASSPRSTSPHLLICPLLSYSYRGGGDMSKIQDFLWKL